MLQINPIDLIIRIPIFVLGLVLHEYAHAYMAYRFGDMTAKNSGRLTLNPIPHLSLFGSIIFPIMTMSMGGFFLAWAKPVPISFFNIPLKKLKKAIIWISLAGPLMNLFLAFLSILLFAITVKLGLIFGTSSFTRPILLILNTSMQINGILCIFNLIPIPPLDGANVLFALLPDRYRELFDTISKYSIFIMIVLIYSRVLGMVLFIPFLELLSNIQFMLVALLGA